MFPLKRHAFTLRHLRGDGQHNSVNRDAASFRHAWPRVFSLYCSSIGLF